MKEFDATMRESNSVRMRSKRLKGIYKDVVHRQTEETQARPAINTFIPRQDQ